MQEIIFIGAGPSNIASACYLNSINNKINFLVIDSGKGIKFRDHNSEFECIGGVGGAGLFSDGKFSYYPAGTNVWKLDEDKLKSSYNFMKSIMDNYDDNVPSFPSSLSEDFNSGLNWTIKDYYTAYLTLEQRYDLINKMTHEYEDKFMLSTEVINIIKHENYYEVICQNTETKEITNITTKKLVFGGGRYMPLFMEKLKFIPMEFKRIELGCRIEGSSDNSLYNASTNIDPKFMKYDSEKKIEYRTFCWCRDGETVCTNFKDIKTWSGRSDCEPTKKSNFGFNLRFKDEKYMHLLNRALITKPFVSDLDGTDVDDNYKEVYTYLMEGLESFLDFTHIHDKESLKILGPTIEGVGMYPVTDKNLKVENENVWVSGDCTGKFRGIIASMLGGIFVAHQILDELNKPIVIFLSGKRFSGKGEASKIIKQIMDENDKNAKITSFSYCLKKKFCELNGLDFERFITDQKYKDTYRDELTKYYYLNNPLIFAEYLENEINNDKTNNVFIVDDLRCRYIQLPYLLNKYKDKWNIKVIRINSTEENRTKRGWFKSSYDDDPCENNFDDYDKFDNIINNDNTIVELCDVIKKIL